MQIPVDVTFRGMDPSPAVEAAIDAWVERLGHAYKRIQRCHVWIDQPHHHRRRGARFHVKLVVQTPGAELAIGHEHGHPDVYLALGDAFAAARRRLQDHARIERGDVKRHAA
jgi:ribosome-associated translation inhibitor RaiA